MAGRILYWIHECVSRVLCCLFFFSSRRRHTRFDCDWSSDVCSSDLLRPAAVRTVERAELVVVSAISAWEIAIKGAVGKLDLKDTVGDIVERNRFQIGRASCRERV